MEQQQEQHVQSTPPIQRLFLISLAAVVILTISFAGILVASLIPYFGVIGQMAVVVVGVLLGCLSVLMIAFTWSRIGAWRNDRNIFRRGDIVIYVDGNKIHHLSAIHERAKVQPLALPQPQEGGTLPVPEEPDDEAVMTLFRSGDSEREIAKKLKVTRAAVRKSLGK